MHTNDKYKRRYLSWTMALVLGVALGACSAEVREQGGGVGGAPDEGSPESGPFSVKSTSPADGSAETSTNQKIAIQFSDEVDASTVNTSTIKVTADDGTPVEGSITVDQKSNIAIFTPSVKLEAESSYHVEVTDGCKSAAGVSLASSFSFTFSTAGDDKEDEAPVVVETTPTDGDIDVSTNDEIHIQFDESAPVDPSTVCDTCVVLKKPDGTPVQVNSSIDLASNILIITPTTKLEASTTYSLDISGDVRSLCEISITNNVTINFTTGEAEEEDDEGEDDDEDGEDDDDEGEDDCDDDGTCPPEVVETTPAEGAVLDVSTVQSLEVKFDQTMDVSTLNSTNITLTQSDGSAVMTNISYDATTSVAIVTPTAALEANTEYHLEVTTGVESETNVALQENVDVNFTTTE